MGICTGKHIGGELGSRVGTIATLGGGSVSTLGDGESLKVMRRGVAWKFVKTVGEDCRIGAKNSLGDWFSGRVRCGETIRVGHS
jgi:hypothetical protein